MAKDKEVLPDLLADPKKIAETLEKTAKKIRIVIEEQNEPGGMDDVFLSVNGNAMLIQRGKEVVIGREYEQVLKEAMIRRLFQINGEDVWKSVPRFAYKILGYEEG